MNAYAEYLLNTFIDVVCNSHCRCIVQREEWETCTAYGYMPCGGCAYRNNIVLEYYGVTWGNFWCVKLGLSALQLSLLCWKSCPCEGKELFTIGRNKYYIWEHICKTYVIISVLHRNKDKKTMVWLPRWRTRPQDVKIRYKSLKSDLICTQFPAMEKCFWMLWNMGRKVPGLENQCEFKI